jgi:DNA invertase Pin-like site-specific DNA recombinase
MDVFGAIAHFERRPIAGRTKDGIAAARARGKLPGRRPLAGRQQGAGGAQTRARPLDVHREVAAANIRRTARATRHEAVRDPFGLSVAQLTNVALPSSSHRRRVSMRTTRPSPLN